MHPDDAVIGPLAHCRSLVQDGIIIFANMNSIRYTCGQVNKLKLSSRNCNSSVIDDITGAFSETV
jgi:hypothetical protein